MKPKPYKTHNTKPLKLALILGLIVLGIIAGKSIVQAIDPPSWTDSTITAGETLIRKVHIDELRSEVNTNEADVGLVTTTWTDPTIAAGETLIRPAHFTEPRSAIEGICNKIEDSLPSWTDATITPGEIIRKTHLDELRTEITNAYDSINAKKCCGSYGGSDTGSAGACPGTDDSECGTIDCSGWYIQTGTEGADSTEYCYNKQDFTSNRCEALDDCKDANTSDCDSQSNDAEQYNCAACKYIHDTNACYQTTLGSCTNYGLGTDCTGTCKSCSGGSCVVHTNQDYQNECNGISCSGYYVQTGTQGADSTEYCYDRADEPAGTHNCEADGTCRDAADDCPSNSADTLKYSCGSCKYISASSCTGTTLGSCTNYGLGTNCSGFCKSCSGGSCVNTANGQDYQNECGGLSCTGYYWGWSGNRCYYRANEPAGTHNCEGNGTCRDAADDCPSNGQGSATGCSSASSACRAGCSGTTGPTCYTSGKHGCSTCKQCNSAGNCVSVTTGWGGGSAYGCSGSTKRCYSGSCKTCGGWMYNGYCWYSGSSGQSCSTVCSGRGGNPGSCSEANNCTLVNHFNSNDCRWGGWTGFPGWCTSTTELPGQPTCSSARSYYRTGSGSCSASHSKAARICACNY